MSEPLVDFGGRAGDDDWLELVVDMDVWAFNLANMAPQQETHSRLGAEPGIHNLRDSVCSAI